MIIGVGIDVVELDRFEDILRRWGKKFLERVFTEREISLAPKDSLRFFAGRFSAKESFMKALGFGIGPLSFRNIEVLRNDKGKPFIVSSYPVPGRVLVSITHTEKFAASVVVIERRNT